MKAKPMKQTGTGQKPCEPSEATHIHLHLPGPLPYRVIAVVQGNTPRRGTPCWTWNGDTEKPTLKPSIRTRGGGTDEVCHTWITDGKVQFLSDCTHQHAGKTMDLLEVDL